MPHHILGYARETQWTTPLCRPEILLPLKPSQNDQTSRECRARDNKLCRLGEAESNQHQFFFPGNAFPAISGPIERKIRIISREFREFVALLGSSGGSGGVVRIESAGLHKGRSWAQIPLLVNGRTQPAACRWFVHELDSSTDFRRVSFA